jgi:hypothetical protein
MTNPVVVSYFGHGNFGIHLEDLLTYLRNLLRSKGTPSVISSGLEPGIVNVMPEGFVPDTDASILSLVNAEPSTRFVFVVTEMTDGTTFNREVGQGVAGRDAPAHNAQYWNERFTRFVELADSYAHAIWCVTAVQIPQYKALFPHIPVLLIPLGFDPAFVPLQHFPVGRKDIDCTFTGTLTPYRAEIFERLAKRTRLAVAPAFQLAAARTDLLARSKCTLHIGQIPGAVYTSPMRHHQLIMSACPVLSERSREPGDLDQFVHLLPSGTDGVDRLIDSIVAYLESETWHQGGHRALEHYRQMPIGEDSISALLESLIS